MAAVAAIAIFVVAYVLIATEKIHRTAVALGGAALMRGDARPARM